MKKSCKLKNQVICLISNECETQHELPPIIVSFPPLHLHFIQRFIVYISFAQILFCFRVTLQSYFPLIDFLHFVLSPQTYSFPWHIWFLLNCQSIYSLVWTKIYIQVLQRPTRIRHFVMIERFLHTSWVFGFVYDNFLFTLKITRIRIGLCTTWIDLWT